MGTLGFRGLLLRSAATSAALCIGSWPASGLAQQQTQQTMNFDLPRQSLAGALKGYAQVSGQPIIFTQELVDNLQAPALQGMFTPDQALEKILKGSRLIAEHTPSGAVMIERSPAPDARPVRVAQASRRPSAAPAESTGIETVVVTAQHRSENIQQVPIAITALSQQQLTERQIAGGPDLVKEVPNLTFSKTNFSGYNLEIRGIGTQAISVTTDPAVAVAFNDIPFIRNHFFEQEFYDLDDAEVLRGPQGTLYGRNATAGVVNIKSALPTDTYEAMLSADLGNYNNRRLEGMINLPIVGDTLDLRIAGEWTKRDGYSFNTLDDQPIDGRDLWSGRMTLGWKPASNIQTYLVWEHFSEDDDRMRSGKQLCKTAPGPSSIDGYLNAGSYLSQGCEDTSLYSPDAFETPDAFVLPYFFPLASGGAPINSASNVYLSTTQSTNLRDIEAAINPTYKVKNDTLEWNTIWQIDPALTLTSQTGYNRDFLWSTEDYNRFASAPDAFTSGPVQGLISQNPNNPNDYIFCDPQLGCNDRLALEDLSDEHAWQVSQEFRLASNFSGPFNFSLGANYLHYETEENYYVFGNTLTLAAASFGSDLDNTPGGWIPGVTSNSQCLGKYAGYRYGNPAVVKGILSCIYIDPNPIGSLNNEGHNYFLSQNPYMLNSYALFGETYYNLTNDLKLTTGARWTDDQKTFIDIPSELLIPGYGYETTGIVRQEWDRWTGRGVLDWTPKLDFTDQTLIYASVSHGYKAGGANPPGALFPVVAGFKNSGIVTEPIHPLTFKPEYIEAFELGTKNTLLDNALTLNGDIFYYNYTGYQISEIVDRTAINDNYNAHVEGAEFEMNWEPLPGLKFGFNQGLENAVLAGGDSGIDLMDRTAGMPGWEVVKPFVTEASNCILPVYVVELANPSTAAIEDACDQAYNLHVDPITGLPYVPNPTVSKYGIDPAPYPGFDPLTAPNNGEGFSKHLGGNQLPNAPHFTSSLTAEYSMPVSDDWVATFHTDFYWQSQQWARVFEDAIDKIRGYSTTNVSLILTSSNGWQVMAYVKNVFDVTAITGTFLNSDDTGLTTNVFLTDPRLFGIRVTKHLDEADGFWGSEYNGADFFTGLFSDTDNGKPPLWIELGGDFSNLTDASQAFDPAFLSTFAPNRLKSPLPLEDAPHYGFDESVKISYQPDGSDWVFSGGIRYGRNGATHELHQQPKNPYIPVHFTVDGLKSLEGSKFYGYSLYPSRAARFQDVQAKQTESHTIVDFLVGKDVGLGMFGLQGSSVVSGGVRVAQFMSKQDINLHAAPDVHYPSAPITSFAQKYQFTHSKIRYHQFAASAEGKESFHGLGPKLDWNASTPVAGNESGNGEITVDWGASFAVLFGRQKAQGINKSSAKSYYLSHATGIGGAGGYFFYKNGKKIKQMYFQAGHFGFNGQPIPTHQSSNSPQSHNRSRMVAVPNLGGFAGISYKYQNAKVSFGYRADEFFGAMDGGIDAYKAENRGFFGPFANISIGLGG
jgi:iron complex outermembrane receptor protein